VILLDALKEEWEEAWEEAWAEEECNKWEWGEDYRVNHSRADNKWEECNNKDTLNRDINRDINREASKVNKDSNNKANKDSTEVVERR